VNFKTVLHVYIIVVNLLLWQDNDRRKVL